MQRLGPIFVKTAAWLATQVPEITFVAPFANQRTRDAFEALWQQGEVKAPLTCIDGQARETMAAADVVLLASGTATLEALLVGRPMVVAYKVSPFSYWLARLLKLVKLKYFSLPNLLAGEALVPELIQHSATPARLGPAVLEYLLSGWQCRTAGTVCRLARYSAPVSKSEISRSRNPVGRRGTYPRALSFV